MIKINNLTKRYGTTLAVDNLNIEIPRGQILGLLGPNGAGKSTTLRMITGYLPPTSGAVFVNDYEVTQSPRSVKNCMGYLPESAPLYADMMVFDYLEYIAAIRGIDKSKKRDRLQDLSRLCGIREVMHKPISALSKGYKQRVGLALALMSDPPILVLDEPTSGLDPNQIAEIRTIVKEIGKEKTIIFSTHILSEAEATCDRVIIINKGNIVADGSAEDLKTSLVADRFLRLRLKKAAPENVKKKLESLDGILSVSVHEDAEELEVEVKGSEDLRELIYGTVKKQRWILLEMIQERQSLEKIFRELTKEASS